MPGEMTNHRQHICENHIIYTVYTASQINFDTLSVSHGLFLHNRKQYGRLNIGYRAINFPVRIQTFIAHCLAVVKAL